MATKQLAPKLLTVRMHERAPLAGVEGRPARINRSAGILFGVKVVGRNSPNTHGVNGVDGTEYTLECLEAALPLYEGIKVNVDHPPRQKPNQERSARDRFAWIENVHVQESGIYGDLHFLDPEDPLAVKILNAAELRPDAFALSHNAVGKGEVRNRRYIVTEIPEVNSVDIVADGGTNRSLFEGRNMKQAKVCEVLREKVLPALQAGRKKRLAKLLESIPSTLLMEDDEGKDHLDHLYDAMRSAKEAGHDDVAKGVHKLMHPDNHDIEEEEEPEAKKEEGEEEEGGEKRERSEMEGEGEEGPGESGEHNQGPDGKGGPQTKFESEKRKPLKPTEVKLTESRALAMCKTAGVEATADVLEAIKGADFDQAMRVINLAKRAQSAARSPAPRSVGAHRMQESLPATSDVKGWINRLRN
jgi:hypothetical protein